MSPADPEDRDDSACHPADSAAESVAGSAAESIAGSAAESIAGSAGVSAAFEDIVAGWRAEGGVPDWPADRLPHVRRRSAPTDPEPDSPALPPGERPTAAAAADHPVWPTLDHRGQRPLPPRSYTPPPDDDDHFIPPEPPPLPRIGRAAAIGMGLIAIGLTLLLAPGLLGIAESVGLTLGLLTVAGGLGWLVLGSWASDPPADEYDDDDGAVF